MPVDYDQALADFEWDVPGTFALPSVLADHASDYEVVETTGAYAYVQYAAEAVPDVVGRVARELGVSVDRFGDVGR